MCRRDGTCDEEDLMLFDDAGSDSSDSEDEEAVEAMEAVEAVDSSDSEDEDKTYCLCKGVTRAWWWWWARPVWW